jgi:hypothetical protein
MKMMSWSRYHCLSPSLRKPRKFSRRELDLLGIREWKRRIRLTSPMGRGRRVAPGEGLQPNDKPYPLTPTLSQSKSDISDFDNMRCPTRVNPSWGERGRPWVIVRFETNVMVRYFQFVIRRFRT